MRIPSAHRIFFIPLVILACHRARPETTPNHTPSPTPELVKVTGSVSADTLSAIAARNAQAGIADPMSRANEAARMTTRIVSEPDSVALHVGESRALRSFTFTAYDTSGVALPGFVPRFDLEDTSVVTFSGFNVIGVRRGTTRLTVIPMVFDTTRIRPRARTALRLIVMP